MVAASYANKDAWMEQCLVAITVQGGTAVAFASLTETVDIDMGSKDIEGIPILNGGRVTKWNPEGDTTVTFEAYPIEAGTDSGATGKGFFDLLHSADATQPISITNNHTRNKYRVALCWTDDPNMTDATTANAASTRALRLAFADGMFTSVKPSFTDGILKFNVVFKVVPFDKSNNGNIKVESSDGSAQLAALAAYTNAVKF